MGINKYDNQGLRGHQTEGNTAQTNGQVWFVDGNSGNAGNTSAEGASWDLPFSTLNYAISRCTNDAGDIIYIAPGHTETIADTSPLNQSGTVTDELCVDKSGITIVGVGTGTNRPTFTFASNTDATLEVRASDVTIRNLILVNNLANTIAMVTGNASADGFIIENCEFRDSGAALEAVLQITLPTAMDDVTIRGNRFYNTAANDGNTTAIFSTGATTRLKIYDNVFRGDWNAAVMDLNAAQSYDTEIVGNVINNLDATVASVIQLNASTTGVVKDNVIHSAAGGTGGGAIVAAGALLSNNRIAVNEGQNAVEEPGSVGGTRVGNHWYVDSGTGATTASGTSWFDVLSLVDDAIGKCTASNGDVIHVAAGHAEADMDGTSGQIFDVDVVGVTIIGEGSGNARPTFTFTTDAANALVDLTADDCRLSNLRFLCNMDDQAQIIKLSGDDCEIDNCEFLEGGQVPLTCITIGAADGDSDNAYIHDNRFYIPTADDGNSAIDIVKDMAGIRIEKNYFRGDWDDAVIDVDTGGDACTDLRIVDNVMINQLTGQHLIQISGVAVTGLIASNTFVNDTRDQAAQPSLCQMVNNKWVALGTGQVGIDNVDPNNAGIHLFVDSGATGAADTAGHGYSWAEPLATVDAAINLATASNDDVIHLAPGHAETLTTATYVTVDKAGITIIGHGKGTDRPTFTFDTGTDTTWVISAANFSIENCIFVNTQDALVVAFPISAAHATFKSCVFRDDGTDNTLEWITATANADYLTIIDCVNEGTDTAGNNSWVTINGLTNFEMRGCRSNGDFVVANVAVLSVACTDLLIDDCRFENANAIDVCIEGFAASTGWISNTYCWITTDAQVTWVNTPGSISTYECYGANNDGEAGMIIGTVSQ